MSAGRHRAAVQMPPKATPKQQALPCAMGDALVGRAQQSGLRVALRKV